MNLLYPCNGAVVEIYTTVQRKFIARNRRDGSEPNNTYNITEDGKKTFTEECME